MSTRTLAALGVAGPLLFAVVVLFLDVVQYDYLVANGDGPWTTSPVSVNALGPYGWLQIVNFGVLGLSVIALSVAAHRGIRGESRSIVGPAFIALWGVAFLVSMFPIERQPQSFNGYAHGIAFAAASLTLIPMYVFMWASTSALARLDRLCALHRDHGRARFAAGDRELRAAGDHSVLVVLPLVGGSARVVHPPRRALVGGGCWQSRTVRQVGIAAAPGIAGARRPAA